MITTNVLLRVFQIRYNNVTGTCFLIDQNGEQYYVTAKHVIESVGINGRLEMMRGGFWEEKLIIQVSHSPNSDVSVFRLDNMSHDVLPMPATILGLSVGQDLYFAGFPYGFRGDTTRDGKPTYPMPLVKKTILSGITQLPVLLLDGFNNPGFSGGPVVAKIKNSSEFSVVGIISGHHQGMMNVYQADQIMNIQMAANSGIIAATSINVAIELIRLMAV